MNELFFKLLEEIDPNKLNMVYSSPNGMIILKSSEYDFKLEQIHELKRENIKLQEIIDKALKHTHEILGFLENCVGGNEQEIQKCIKIFNKYLEILKAEE